VAVRRKIRARDAQLAFEALSIEGGLLSPEWLSKVAQLQAGQQSESDYRIPKGLNIRDEMGRYWRIAQAHWTDFATGRKSNADPKLLASRFVTSLLREAFGFTSLTDTAPLVVAERSYPIGDAALGGRVPVVVAPADAGLDTLAPSFGDGGRRRSAFGLAQEFLNAQEGALWGVATDGVTLRIVRDNASLTRPAWIEVNLGRIFTEERYADFAALWLLLHETRFGREGQAVSECALENWRSAGREEGTRAREHLREGVKAALLALGQGFITHPSNTTLRADLQSGALTTKDYFNQLLRLVYRLIFLLTVEERGLLHPPDTANEVKALYAEGYGLRRLRERSLKRSAHDRFADLWEATKIVFRGVAAGEPRLGLPALAGIFAVSQCPALDAAALENRWLLLAAFKLAWLRDEGALARVNWRDMGPEELGSVYESLLELVPQITEDGRQFAFATGGETKGNARKTTGSYYTPDSLVQVVLDSALKPVITETIARNPSDPIEALLSLSIVDPACGSGHFLLAAARRLAAHVARLQANGTPSAAEYRHALRQVVGRCIYGVDLNPMAVELCKVSLWMEAVEPGLPLTFLNSHIQHGNALLGTTPELMAKGIPDKAWDPIEGDDKKIASALKKRNKAEGGGQRTLQFETRLRSDVEREAISRAVAELEATSDATPDALAQKEVRWDRLLDSNEYRHQKFVADSWCSSFFWPKHLGEFDHAAPTNELWRQLCDGERQAPPLTVKTVSDLTRQYAFLHWHLQFPRVFAGGGFDVILGNPPWERVKLQEQEFFALRHPAIALAANADARKKMIAELPLTHEALWRDWCVASREAEGQAFFVRESGRYPLCGRGDVNTFALFAELDKDLSSGHGTAGFIVPTSIATDETTKGFFSELMSNGRLRSLFSFRETRAVFTDTDSTIPFCLLAIGPPREDQSATFAFELSDVGEIRDPARRYRMTLTDVAYLNPNSGTCPLFRSGRDATINKSMYLRAGVFQRDGDANGNPWSVRFLAMFHMASDSGLFERSRVDSNSVPTGPTASTEKLLTLYEAKMIHHFDHRFGDFGAAPDREGDSRQLPVVPPDHLADPWFIPKGRYRVQEREVSRRLSGEWSRRWMLAWRDITRNDVQRTVIAAILPLVAAGHTLPLFLGRELDGPQAACLLSNLNSFALDYAGRQKIGGVHLTYGILKQLPLFPPNAYTVAAPWTASVLVDWLVARVLELTYTAWDLEPFADDVDYDGPPFRWDPERRFLLRCELDAAFFHLYGLSRDDTDYVMDTFPIVRKNDEKAHNEYRTKRVILDIYDAMAEATRAGQPYQTRLDPPPADPRVAHPPRGAMVIPFVASSLPSQPDRYRELPAWTPDVLPAVAERTTGLDLSGSWASHLSGYDLGFAALAAVLRSLPGPSSREDVERAVVLALLPRLMQSKFEAKMVGMWRRLIGADMALTSIASLSIPWNQILRLAVNQRVLEIVEGRWNPGPEVQDAPSPALDARAIISLSWLVNAGAEDQELNAQLGVLNVA
jgi:hypothetical protein